jgi:ribosomal peptide maturation radical SAM protein 1
MKKILLLSMPFGALERQALGLSLFKTRLRDEGFQCDIRYLTFTFARLTGVENYCWVSSEIPHTAFAGEWIFTDSLYDTAESSQSDYLHYVLKGIWQFDDMAIRRILKIKNMAQKFLDYCMKTIKWEDYSIIGFTSTFEQNIASLALAKRIKSEYPKIKIAFGGANWEGEMGIELHRRFAFVDYGFTGEADESFPDLIKLLDEGKPTEKSYKNIPGLIYRYNGKSLLSAPSKPVSNLDSLPIPDYSDYFSEFDQSSTGSFVVPALLFESARGCWWGARHHCMFCGLNGNALTFRAKSSSRVLGEIEYLSSLWKMDMLQAVDNVINMTFFDDLFPALSERKTSLRFFYEIRANLSREQVRLLSNGGVKNVQPGIESLNDHILHLMNKGTSALQNIQVLKWCKEYGIRAAWNLLYGFPGELDKDYEKIFDIIPKIKFLGAPTACGPIRLDRFSPYFNEQQAIGFINVRPILPYKYLYPFDLASINKIACYFDYDYAPGTKISGLSGELIRRVEEWQKNPEKGSIKYMERPDGELIIVDDRSVAVQHSAELNGIDKEVYMFCDKSRTVDAIEAHIKNMFPEVHLERDQIIKFLSALVDCGYQLTDGNSYLSLAINAINTTA